MTPSQALFVVALKPGVVFAHICAAVPPLLSFPIREKHRQSKYGPIESSSGCKGRRGALNLDPYRDPFSPVMAAELDWISISGLHLSLIPDPNPCTWTRREREREKERRGQTSIYA